MFIRNFFRFLSDTEASGGTDTVDRGDDLEPIDDTASPDTDQGVKDYEAGLDKNRKDDRIPQARHKEILEKERAKRVELERQLAQLQAGQQTSEINTDLSAAEANVARLEKEYVNLLTDGEVDRAAEVMAEIRATERSMAEARSDMKIQAAETRATERARYTTALERIEASYPELNPESEVFSTELINEVVELKGALELKGMTPTAAMQRSVQLIMGAGNARQTAATSVTPRVSTKEVAAERRKEAAGRTVKAVGNTPASLNRVGQDGDRYGNGSDASIMNMSQKEFAQLSEAQLSRMRGDEL